MQIEALKQYPTKAPGKMVNDKKIQYYQPAYKQVRDLILEKINNKEFLPGEAIPSEYELAEIYGVSRVTIRSALLDLQREAILQSIQGKGVFVLGEPVNRNLDSLTGFTRSIKELDKNPKNSLVNSFIRKAGPFFADIFKINEEDEIHYIKRISSVDKIPTVLEEIYVPTEILPNLMKINTNDFSMYDIYDYYGIKVSYAEQVLEVTKLDKNEARLLNINEQTPVFLLKCVTHGNDNKPIEFSLSYVNGEISRFRSEFDKNFIAKNHII
ncbi:GntR family transcriptional regulator [Anaerococcus ihuae]|uniref:GntR family transcriptional regulator n=1 Tax=Anaerococcus ihuae TaxID=2899519 RepID=UPI001F42C241|nr:GntR family transcriptional regulator [Anaerococcus ihuae]